MREYILLLPIIFIFHDMEEIVGFSTFFKNNPWIYERYPRITKPYRNLKTECLALAVYEEFIPFFGLSLLAYYFPGKIMYTLWYGLLLALTLHFVVHIAQSIIIRKYIPSLITSIICLPVSIMILAQNATLTEFDLVTVLCLAGAVIFLIVNLKFAHRLMHWFAKKNGKNNGGE